jgi:hypothetical protein
LLANQIRLYGMTNHPPTGQSFMHDERASARSRWRDYIGLAN